MGRSRSWYLTPRVCFGVAAVLAAIVVISALPRRMEAGRTATNAYVPLRGITAEEAIALMESSATRKVRRTQIVHLTGNRVTIATRDYLVPASGARAATHATVGGKLYRVLPASWENYSLEYTIPRDEYERRLGRKLSSVDIDAGFVERHPVSFRHAFVPLYAGAEWLFLTLWGGATALALIRVRRVTLMLPIVWVASALPMMFVLVYSPAFFDADWFYQRVVVEDIALGGVFLAYSLLIPAGISAALFVFIRPTEWLALRLRVPARRARVGAYAAGLAALLLACGIRYAAYRAETGRCLGALSALRRSFQAPGFDWVAEFEKVPKPASPMRSNLVESIAENHPLRRALQHLIPKAADREMVVLVHAPTERGEASSNGLARYLYLAHHGTTPYADFREVRPRGQLSIQAAIDPLLFGEPTVETGFFRFLPRGQHLCGEQAIAAERRALFVSYSGHPVFR